MPTMTASEQCIKNIERLFYESCPDRGRRISRSELLCFLGLVTRGAITDATLEQLVDVADKDGSGVLDIVDFLSFLFSQAKDGQRDSRACLLSGLSPGLGTPPVGTGSVYLATLCARDVPHVDQLAERTEPAFGSTIEQFRAEHAGDKQLLARLLNKVRVCPKCSKPCAYTLDTCNSCGNCIADVSITHTDNVFMGFIYGIARGRFPYTISMRTQTPDILCFDDPLAMTVCHLNCIPTSVYIPDFRYLFADPVRGLKLVTKLWKVAATAALEQFWGNDAFRERFFAGQPKPGSTAKLRDYVIAGMNFPPSMYQLHLQFIHLPLLPFHYNMAQDGTHFTHGRFFPLEYIEAALAFGDRVKMDISERTDVASIMERISSVGVNYDEAHAKMMRRCRSAQELFSAWEERDFAHQVVNGRVLSASGVPEPGKDAKELQKEDTKALQNYGRPFDASGKPTGTHYKYAKRPKDVASFVSGAP